MRVKFIPIVIVGLVLMACTPVRPSTPPPSAPVSPTAGASATATAATATAVATETVNPSPSPSPKANEPKPLETPASADPNPIPVEQMPEDVAIVLRREGGFVGRKDLWTIYNAGRVESNKGDIQQIGKEAVSALLQDLTAHGFFDLQDRYINPGCADCYEYTLTVHYQGNIKTVQANDAGKMPDTLRQWIDKIVGLAGSTQ